jgi:chemotaxis signal transduction protein
MNNPSSPRKTENYLSFYLTPQYQALLSTRQLAEIIHLEASEIVPIPEMPSAVAGVCSWQGDVLWLVDLSYWSGAAPLLTAALTSSKGAEKGRSVATDNGSSCHCSVLKVKCQGGTLGLLVHQVGQLQSCEVQQIQSLKDSAELPQFNGGSEVHLTPKILPISPHGRPTIRQECIKGIWKNPSGELLPILDLDTVVQHLVQ